MEGDSENGNAGARRKPVGEARKKISLEAYIDFFVSNKSLDLTINFLNQIIHMHGFRKLHGAPKKTLTDAINTLDLIDPSRSTLREQAISSAATLTLEDVIADLENLKWQECCVTSLQILNAQNEGPLSSSAVAEPTLKSSKRKKARKKKLLDCLEDDGSGNRDAKKNPAMLKKKRNAAAAAASALVDLSEPAMSPLLLEKCCVQSISHN